MRLFVAIELSNEMKQALVSLQDSIPHDLKEELRIIPSEQLHLTLKFLGESEEVSRIEEELEEITSREEGFEWRLGSCGVFPERGAPRILWCGLLPSSDVLARLKSSCEHRFASLGFEQEIKPFTPHITIARVRRDARAHGLRKWSRTFSPSNVPQTVSEIALIHSVLTPVGASYSIIRKFPLGSR